MLEPEVVDYLKTIDINILSLNEIIQNLDLKFDCSFEDRREEIEEALVSLNFETPSDEETLDLELAKQLQEQERRHSARNPVKKRKLSSARSEKAKPRKNAKSGLFHRPLFVSEDLAVILGRDKCSRPEVVQLLWKYIKENDLQDPQDRRFILCDEKLSKIFKKKRVSSFGMNRDISRHLIIADVEHGLDDDNEHDDNMDQSTNGPSVEFPETTVNIPSDWQAAGITKEVITYHDLQLEILKRVRKHRDSVDPDKIHRPKDDSIISELMGPTETSVCRTSDLLKNLRAKFQSQIGVGIV